MIDIEIGFDMNIYDIAEKSGVSIATISRVLNGGKNVSKKTYRKVMDVIETEGYTPNVFARGLGLNTMKTIGILVTDVSDVHYARIISLLSEYLRELDMDVLLGCTGSDVNNKKKELEILLEKRVDAIFLAGSAVQELEDNSHLIEAAGKVPVIMINGYIDAPGIINVFAGEEEATADCIRKLSACGICHPLYLYDRITYSGMRKMKGFQRGLEECRITETQESMLQVEKDLEAIDRAIECRLAEGARFDAVLGSEDIIAIGALKALQKRGIDVPVIGYNNSVFAEISSPQLTSIDNMLEPICRTAVQFFHDVLDGKETASKAEIACKLVERESFDSSRRYKK